MTARYRAICSLQEGYLNEAFAMAALHSSVKWLVNGLNGQGSVPGKVGIFLFSIINVSCPDPAM
jgi:hypothetical protein